MSALDDLKGAGFSDAEVSAFASQKRQALLSGGFSEKEADDYLGTRPAPNMAQGNKTFAQTITRAMTTVNEQGMAVWNKLYPTTRPIGQTIEDIGTLSAPVEAALNAGTGLLFGFPAYVGAGLGGLVSKHLLGTEADPKEIAENMSRVMTYQPMTKAGIRLSGNVMFPLVKLQEGAQYAGEAVTGAVANTGAQDERHRAQYGTPAWQQNQPDSSARRAADREFMQTAAPALGALTDASIQMLTPLLLSELARKMGGQTVGPDDMRNVAKVVANGPEPTAGVQQAQANNTFTGQPAGAGRLVGYAQPKGTPVEKLFSNFANDQKSTAEQKQQFRSQMLDRANADPKAFAEDHVSTSEEPFVNGMTVRTDAAEHGGTRVQVLDGEQVVAAAGIRNGMIDSIAVDERFKGSAIGKSLLVYLDEKRIANIDEVPDRSPGFVAIQKTALQERQARAVEMAQRIAAVEDSLHSAYEKTGIGPYTIAEAAAKDPALRAELTDPAVDVPAALEPFIEKPAGSGMPPETGDYVVNNPIVGDGPNGEGPLAVRVITHERSGETIALVDGQAPIELTKMLESGMSVEQALATTFGDHPQGAPADATKVQRAEPIVYREGAGTLNMGVSPDQVVSAVRGIVKDATDVVNGVIDSKAGQEVVGALFPMNTGSVKAQAVAQRFANAMRVARYQWQRMTDFLQEKFTPEERRAMWDAADEENVLRTSGIDSTGKGLDRLTPKQRDAVEHLHELSQGLWSRAQAAGMVEGEGLPFWTPRMAVRIGEDGGFLRPGGGGKAATSKGEGGNVKTSTPNTKQRKHTLAEETEAAMKAKLGDDTELVRDIGVMPVAMARMAQAIAGRELVNQLKEYGQAIGEPVVSESGGPGFTTIDHPAFTTYRPEMILDAEGKTVPRRDQNGDIVMTRDPMKVSDEWAGPLDAVMSKTDGTIYSAYMLMKSKAMAAIMISPAAHNMVIFGRALAYDPAAVGSLKAYFSGHALAKDPGLMNQAISDGVVPLGANKSSMMDVTDIARGIGKEGGWGDANQSWINLATQKVLNIFSEKAGTNVKAAMDAFGDWWHHTLLWKQVGALQMYIWNDYRNLMLEQGHPPEVAGPVAAHLANRYAGAVAAENSSEMLRKTLNVLLFSRSFNVGNIGAAAHDTVFGLPPGLRAKMFVDAGDEAAAAGVSAAAAKARMGLVADYAMAKIITAAVSAGVGTLLLNQTPEDIKNGYVRRLGEMMSNIQEHPLTPGSYDPDRILPTWDNEVGKQDRIDLGAQPGGRHEYLRLPTGKVIEDTVGWLLHAPTTFEKKLSPMVKAAWQAVTNDKGFGVPVEDPQGSTGTHIAQGIQHVLEAQVPMEQLKTLADVVVGHGTDLDKHKLVGFATGFSTSQGNPRGPEEAAFYAQQDRVKAEKAYAMEAVRADIKQGKDADAFERLRAIGLPPREIVMTINSIKSPREGMSRSQVRKFIVEANDEDRATLARARQ